MSIDVIGNFLTIIRNGIQSSKPFVLAPHSKVNLAITEVLKQEGFINEYGSVNESDRKMIKVALRYVDGESAIHELTRVSKPSSRRYSSIKSVRPVIGGLGVSILTTNKGIISNTMAQKLNVGGEVICTVW